MERSFSHDDPVSLRNIVGLSWIASRCAGRLAPDDPFLLRNIVGPSSVVWGCAGRL